MGVPVGPKLDFLGASEVSRHHFSANHPTRAMVAWAGFYRYVRREGREPRGIVKSFVCWCDLRWWFSTWDFVVLGVWKMLAFCWALCRLFLAFWILTKPFLFLRRRFQTFFSCYWLLVFGLLTGLLSLCTQVCLLFGCFVPLSAEENKKDFQSATVEVLSNISFIEDSPFLAR